MGTSAREEEPAGREARVQLYSYLRQGSEHRRWPLLPMTQQEARGRNGLLVITSKDYGVAKFL
jgi:hypothetical protein